MTAPATMTALVQLHDGYSDASSGPGIDRLDPYLGRQTIPVPHPGDGQALIKVHLAGVNPSDIHFIKGEYGQPRAKGKPAGFEGVGEVVAGDTDLVGKRVSFFATASGAWAEYAMTDAAGLVPCRPDLAETDAAAQLVNPLTAIAMFDIVLKDGAESFVLNAAGSQLGKLLIALARDHGVAPVAVIRRAEQASALKDLGAAEVIVTSADDPVGRAREIFHARKPRVLLDAVADQLAAEMFFAMPDNARWITYGKLSGEAPRLTGMGQLIFRHKVIEGFWLSRWMANTSQDRRMQAIAEVQDRFVTGKWQTDLAGIVPLSDALNALPEVLSRKDGKAFIDARK